MCPRSAVNGRKGCERANFDRAKDCSSSAAGPSIRWACGTRSRSRSWIGPGVWSASIAHLRDECCSASGRGTCSSVTSGPTYGWATSSAGARRGPAILWRLPLFGREQRGKPPSSSGLGHRPFKAAARVRIPLGARTDARQLNTRVWRSPVVLIALSRRRSRDRSPSPAPDPPGQVAQLAEHAAENRGVGSSILPLATNRPGPGATGRP
jgi:hypothetical protein